MPLDGDALGLAIMAAVTVQAAATPADRTAIFKAMGHAIVDYIKSNALVTGTTASACVAGGATGTCIAAVT